MASIASLSVFASINFDRFGRGKKIRKDYLLMFPLTQVQDRIWQSMYVPKRTLMNMGYHIIQPELVGVALTS
jgi:hypothetical protein